MGSHYSKAGSQDKVQLLRLHGMISGSPTGVFGTSTTLTRSRYETQIYEPQQARAGSGQSLKTKQEYECYGSRVKQRQWESKMVDIRNKVGSTIVVAIREAFDLTEKRSQERESCREFRTNEMKETILSPGCGLFFPKWIWNRLRYHN